MFERLSFSFNDAWFERTTVDVFYDEQEDKSYCYYFSSKDKVYDENLQFDKKEIVLDGHELITELENCNFRNWFNYECPFVLDGVHFELKFNDKNKQEESRTGRNAFPDNFIEFLEVFKKYFPDADFYEVKIEKEYYTIYDHKQRLLRSTFGWHDNKKTLKYLENLTHYIDIFESKTKFGKWKPEQNTEHSYSSENHITYIKSVNKFIKDVKRIADNCKDLDLYNNTDILDILNIQEINNNVEKNLLDNRSAMLLIMQCMEQMDYKYSDYKLEEALKNGTIVRILKFIKKFNNFD